MDAKIMAMMIVGVMMFSGCVVMMNNEETDATTWAPNGSGNTYSYTLHYDSSEMGNTAAQELQLSITGVTPISHTSGTTTLSSVANEGSWGFDATTGVGPFNSFYAAFDINNGNAFVSILDPYDLTKKIDGTPLGTMSNYNIMWVLPTVYWSVDQNGDVTLTNDSTSGGTAYAHTINGVVLKYIAYGVYEGSTATVGGQTVLTSNSGATPTVTLKKSVFREYADNYSMSSSLGDHAYSMLWNYYQFTLYKLCSFTVMEGFYSQSIVGNGFVYGSGTLTTGLTDSLGPYAGNPGPIASGGAGASSYGTNSVKLFIENVWGSSPEFVDGILIDCSNNVLYLNSSSVPNDSTTISSDNIQIQYTMPSGGWGTEITTNAPIWGLNSTTQSSNTNYDKGTTDYSYSASSGTKIIAIGGAASSSVKSSPFYGLSYYDYDLGLSAAPLNHGTRLLLAFDRIPANVAINVDNNQYGSVNMGSISGITYGDPITINGNTITYNETTVIATPTDSDVQYTYAFDGWYDNSTLLSDGPLTITGDMTITAHFSRTTNQYTATITNTTTSFGSVSPVSVTADYGSAISSASNVLTIGSTDVTATPETADAQYTYAFGAWGTFPATLTQDIEITVSFTQTINEYTITWSISGVTSTETYQYGQMPTHEDPTPPEGYLFAGWSPALAVVTQDQTYTAVFEEIVYITVTFDPNGGQLEGDATKVVGIGTPYGDLPTAKKDNNRFIGWFTEAEGGDMVTSETIVTADADHTLYAHWELTGFAAMLKPLLFLFPLILLAFLAIALVRTFA